MPVRVVSAEESAERDQKAINNGTASRTLMQRAGSGAAAAITQRFGLRLNEGVLVFVGSGNNGGDGWVVAGQLAKAGIPVTVTESATAKTPDAVAERDAARTILAASSGRGVPTMDAPGIVVDALLGTGFRGEPHGSVREAISRINELRASGSAVAALDVPSGLDATTGARGECVLADLTVSFGGLKRGTLLARDCCGEIVVVDIGLDVDATKSNDRLPLLIDRTWVASRIPPLRYDTHKGARKHLAIVGGASGMGGAVVLGSRAALRSGIGLVRALVAQENTTALLLSTPAALVSPWSSDRAEVGRDVSEWADAIVVGPGLGRSSEARDLLDVVLDTSECPLLMDADALNAFEHDTDSLRERLRNREALITPHAAEFARLAGTDVKTVLAERFDIGSELAAKLGATVLLKGAPTVIFNPGGDRFVAPRGTAALGTGGSGDILAGIAGTLLAQTGSALAAAGCAAWMHGRAAELCGYVRGTTLEDILYALPRAWNEKDVPLEPPLIARLPAVAQ